MLTYTSQCAFVPQLVRYINARAMPPPMLQMVGCVGPIIALMNNGGWWGGWGPSQWIADVLSLGWLATNCTNLMPPSARIVCTTHNVHGSQRTSSHIWRWLRWRRSVCSGQSVAGPWLKFPHSVRRKKMYTQCSCESVPHNNSCTGWFRWGGCRQCVKVKVKVKVKV